VACSTWRSVGLHPTQERRLRKNIRKIAIACYNKCIKQFFGFCRLDSMTQILIRLHLSSLDTLLHNARISFDKQCSTSSNCLVQYLSQLMSYAGF